MRRHFFLLALLILSLPAAAQTLNVQTGSVTYAIPASQAGTMTYTGGTTLTILGKTLSLDSITSMYIDGSEVTDGTVTVTYSGDSAHVLVAGNIMRYITPAVSGAHVSLLQTDEAGDDTSGEITYRLGGSSSNGSLTLQGSYKCTLSLLGLTLTNPQGAALDIQNGKRIDLSVKKETVNTLTDGEGGAQKGCIACKGHLELKGKGTLNVYGNTAHGIYAKEYVELKNCTVNVLKAVKDGINCNQYFLMESGELNISGTGDDGVQVSFKDSSDRDEEDTGTLTLSGGTLTATVTAAAAKALKAEAGVNIAGGTLNLTATGHGTWDSDELKTKASACIGADGDVLISDGTLVLTATGGGGKGINCDGTLTISGGTSTVKTSGGMYAYVNGREYTSYTSNADNLNSSYRSSPKGMKADGNIAITGGTVSVTTTGNGAEGIESKAQLTIEGGTIEVNAYDDAINSGSHMYIKGGDITVVASNNDGLDSNGNMYISGGTIRAFGTREPECGIDANEEDGYSVIFTGGTLLAVGGGNSTPSSSASTQPYVSTTAAVTAGSTITLSSGSTTLATFTVPAGYSSSSSSSGGFGGGGRPGGGGPGGSSSSSASILVSCAGLSSGSSYTLKSGSASKSVTAALTGSSGRR